MSFISVMLNSREERIINAGAIVMVAPVADDVEITLVSGRTYRVKHSMDHFRSILNPTVMPGNVPVTELL